MCGGVVLYAAQAEAQLDAEIVEKGRFWMKTGLPAEVTAGSRATVGRKPRQARKGAAVAVLSVCRGGAWLSLVSAIFLSATKFFNAETLRLRGRGEGKEFKV